ncbi:DEAD/DEAH box helicase [Bacillus paranthracis]|uniref:DEAD/DEAH box helicase n=1 Tax=Bacillus paranthracis TaxID=2026186 RepID=UPI0020B64A84|nr:AAA domain-containing protein [Bacillus paranthracis]
MNISDIKHASESIIVELTCNKKTRFQNNTPVKLYAQDNKIILSKYGKDHAVEVKGTTTKEQEQLAKIVERNLPRLSEVVTQMNDDTISVVFKIFPDKSEFNLQIGLFDKFLNSIKNKEKMIDIRKPDESFAEKYFIEAGNFSHAIIGVHIHEKKEKLFETFIICGGTSYIQVKRAVDENEQVSFYVEKIVTSISNDYKFYLIRGELKFKNETTLEKARLETLAHMEDIGNSIEGYMKVWEQYGEIEASNIIQHVESVGYLQFMHSEHLPNGLIRLDIVNTKKLEDFSKNLTKEDKMFTLTSTDPREFFLEGLSVEVYKQFANKAKDFVSVNLAEPIQSVQGRIFVKNEDVETTMPKEGFIFLSLVGDISRIDRRNQARDKIFSAESGMPHLASILEGRSVAKPEQSFIEPISEMMQQKVFPVHPPTPKQKEAIEVALNTPDIAIVQGPPGTGKTTVILGILERLNEISDSTDGMFARNLVSAFQHDAVQNAIDRLEILGLPSIKFGRKSGETGNDDRLIEYTVENWIGEKRHALDEKYPQYRKSKFLEQFDHIHKNYLYSANTKDNTLKLLRQVEALLAHTLPFELHKRLLDMILKFEMSSNPKNEPEKEYLLRKIYSLPVHPIMYEDNGAVILRELIYRIKNEYGAVLEKELEALQQFKRSEKTVDDFKLLKATRKSLLVKILPKEEIFYSPKQKEDVVILFSDISDHLTDAFYATQSGEDAVLIDYIHEYENNPLAIRNALTDYISVIGATNQQAVSRAILSKKGDNMSYDNVLIDEAARSNPLDLFIPMAVAKDRIILVGDHRQLPHIVDESIVRTIESNSEGDVSLSQKINDNINKSTFEHLFVKLKELEKVDGIKRTITLDKQYRTHPLLGDFVSKNFYEIHGEVQINSGLPAELFTHSLPGLENKAAVWLDVPHSEGGEISKRSKSRPVEAMKIVAHMKELMDSSSAKGLNFGIITFYADQVQAIYEELVAQGMAVKDEGQYKILPQYREEDVNGKKIEKLRIGTVDAFQGMEFDVVYLSMVRSNQMSDETEKDRQRKYGFLMVENRLCVSMSRQKKMLIVVGDKAMLETPNAEYAVRALVNYYELCKGDVQYGKTI